MKYEERLIKELKNPDGYLFYEEMWILSEWLGMAEDMSHYNTYIGRNIPILFIYHQLAEEMIVTLNRFCDLIVRASLYPIKISETKPEKHRDFTKNLKVLKSSIEFKPKSKLIKSYSELNMLRNIIGHRLVKQFKDFDIDTKLDNLHVLWRKIFVYQREAFESLHNEIERLKLREPIQKLLVTY